MRSSRRRPRQPWHPFTTRKALKLPVVRAMARRGLVSLHTRVFLGRAEEGRREERREHLRVVAGQRDELVGVVADGLVVE